MPAIQKIYDEYRSQGFVVLGVNATAQDAPLDVVPFINDHSISFPILLDETGDVARKYNLRSLPSSFFVDRSGVIREVVVGQMAEVLIRTYAEEIIKSPAP
jgi:alkyl hydroperoxide reductase subunit AhpC